MKILVGDANKWDRHYSSVSWEKLWSINSIGEQPRVTQMFAKHQIKMFLLPRLFYSSSIKRAPRLILAVLEESGIFFFSEQLGKTQLCIFKTFPSRQKYWCRFLPGTFPYLIGGKFVFSGANHNRRGVSSLQQLQPDRIWKSAIFILEDKTWVMLGSWVTNFFFYHFFRHLQQYINFEKIFWWFVNLLKQPGAEPHQRFHEVQCFTFPRAKNLKSGVKIQDE